MLRRFKIYFVFTTLLSLFLVPHASLAQDTTSDTELPLPKRPNAENMKSLLGETIEPTGFSTSSTVEGVVANVIQTALGLVGIMFFILMVYGGFTWITARGDETRITKAKNIIIMAVIGLAVILLAYFVSNFIISRLT